MSQRNCQKILFNKVGKSRNDYEIEYKYAENKKNIKNNNKHNIPNFYK